MENTGRTEPAIRFGVFEVDPSSGELRKSGIRIRLQDQPFKVLMTLLERPGEVVSRDELRKRIWPTESFGDFDHAVNVAVAKLRTALGDSAEIPRYVETLHRRGYRFVFPVTPARANDTNAAAKAGFMVLPGSAAESRESQAVATSGSRAKRRAWIWASAAILASVAIGARAFWIHSRRPKLTDRDTIVLADFVNMTGDLAFDDALKQALAVELGQSPFLNVLSDRKARETLRLMSRPVSENITEDVGREICLRTGSKALLGGKITSIGGHYLIDLKAVACDTGDSLAQEQVEATNKEDVLRTLSQASSDLRTRLGESLPSIRKFDAPIEATTSSLEALKSYSLGNTIEREKGEAPSIPFLERAVELDRNFALAYAGLATRYTSLYRSSLALEYATKAYQLRDSVSERERLRISAGYFFSRKELEKEAQTYELWAATYPRDFVPHVNLSANYMSIGQYDKALAEGQEGLRLAPDDVATYTNLGFAYILLNRLDEAKATLDAALAHKLDGGGLRWDIYELAFLREDAVQMAQQLAWAADKPGVEDMLLSEQSETEVYYGHVKKARDFVQRAVDSAVRADSRETAALWQATAAWREAELGDAASARRRAVAALSLSSGRSVKMWVALTLAHTGDVSRSKALAEDLEKNNSTYTMLKVLWLPTIRAADELAQRNSAEALVNLQAIIPYELSDNLNMLPAYMRGQAYMMERNGTAAVAEFQKLLDHRGIVHSAVEGALVHLQIGRAYAMRGDTDKARAAYHDFLTLWKDADVDIPVLRQAKTEYAKLQ